MKTEDRSTADESHIYNSHFKLWLAKAFRTLRPSARNTTNGTGSKSTERTLKVGSNGIIFLAFEVRWSRGPDGIRCSDNLIRYQEFSKYSGNGYNIYIYILFFQ